jgi:hypothetical protein
MIQAPVIDTIKLKEKSLYFIFYTKYKYIGKNENRLFGKEK